MKVLMLGPRHQKVIEYLKAVSDSVETYEERLKPDSDILEDVDFLISYGYRHMLKEEVLNRFPKRAINLHIAFLPWNRGADPNLWSILEDTPKGVTIHYLDTGLDTGEILAQQKVELQPDDTLQTSYDRLTTTIEELFTYIWSGIRSGNINSTPQPEGGSFHKLKDRKTVEHLLHSGWDTPVADLLGKMKKSKDRGVACP